MTRLTRGASGSGGADGSCGDEGRAAGSGPGRQLGRGAAGVSAACGKEKAVRGRQRMRAASSGPGPRRAGRRVREGREGEGTGPAGSWVGLKMRKGTFFFQIEFLFLL